MNKQNASALTDAAHDLLAALEQIVDEVSGPSKPFSSDSWLPECYIKKAQAAIAKARGES